MRVLILSLSLLLSGCFYGLLGVDLSPEGRHKVWVDQAQQIVGKNIFNCIDSSPCYQYRGGGAFQGDTVLDSGNVEAAYFGRRREKCRYFFEYEPATGLVVRFRFSEAEKFACSISGA